LNYLDIIYGFTIQLLHPVRRESNPHHHQCLPELPLRADGAYYIMPQPLIAWVASLRMSPPIFYNPWIGWFFDGLDVLCKYDHRPISAWAPPRVHQTPCCCREYYPRKGGTKARLPAPITEASRRTQPQLFPHKDG
jgi:hypothetical protein